MKDFVRMGIATWPIWCAILMVLLAWAVAGSLGHDRYSNDERERGQ